MHKNIIFFVLIFIINAYSFSTFAQPQRLYHLHLFTLGTKLPTGKPTCTETFETYFDAQKQPLVFNKAYTALYNDVLKEIKQSVDLYENPPINPNEIEKYAQPSVTFVPNALPNNTPSGTNNTALSNQAPFPPVEDYITDNAMKLAEQRANVVQNITEEAEKTAKKIQLVIDSVNLVVEKKYETQFREIIQPTATQVIDSAALKKLQTQKNAYTVQLYDKHLTLPIRIFLENYKKTLLEECLQLDMYMTQLQYGEAFKVKPLNIPILFEYQQKGAKGMEKFVEIEQKFLTQLASKTFTVQ